MSERAIVPHASNNVRNIGTSTNNEKYEGKKSPEFRTE